MNNNLTITQIFDNHNIIPVVTLNDIDCALKVANALMHGGINIIEVTLRTDNALEVIRHLSHNLPQLVVGAGTVLNATQYNLAVENGAQFIVSPGLNQELITTSKKYTLPFLPGAITPSEVLTAYSHGFCHLKYFPAESYNGSSSLKSMASVFPQIKFCPTGGIDLSNANKYLSLANVAAIGCSFLVNQDIINQGDFARITDMALEITKFAQQIKQGKL